MDLSVLSSSTQNSSGRTSILSAHSHKSSQSSTRTEEESLLGLVIPTSDTGNAGDIGGFTFPGSEGGSAQRTSRVRDAFLDEEAAFYPDVDFNFDAEGNLVDLSTEEQPVEAKSRPMLPELNAGSAVTARMRREPQEASEAGQQEACVTHSLHLGASLMKTEC